MTATSAAPAPCRPRGLVPPPSAPSCFPVQAATQAIVLDTLYLAVLLLAVGLPAYALVRHFQPLLQWERRGNVWTSPFLGTDILAVALLAFAARWTGMQDPAADGTIGA